MDVTDRHRQAADKVLAEMDSGPEGLNLLQVRDRAARYGRNVQYEEETLRCCKGRCESTCSECSMNSTSCTCL